MSAESLRYYREDAAAGLATIPEEIARRAPGYVRELHFEGSMAKQATEFLPNTRHLFEGWWWTVSCLELTIHPSLVRVSLGALSA